MEPFATRWELDTIYYFTATIEGWKPLMKDDSRKDIVISSLHNLTKRDLIRLYGYVIMPNHIHLIAEMLQLNGRQFPLASLTSYTGHEFKKVLSPFELEYYPACNNDRDYQFWKRRPQPVELYTKAVLLQKLDYIDSNPVQAHWNLCASWDEYRYSSARFYEYGEDEFKILTHYQGYI